LLNKVGVKKIRKILVCLILASLVAIMTVTVLAKPAENGNGAPSGPHFNLNLIGMSKEKVGEMDNNNSHRIFVKLTGKTRILLQEGDFAVIDADGTDGPAIFQLPAPGDVVAADGTTYIPENAEYKVYIRALGKPGGTADMWSGFIDEYDNEWLSLEVINLSRGKGKSSFEDVTKELTTIYVDITDDDTENPLRYKLFDNELWEYFWDYDNNGLRIVQLRFYPVLD
jgi:hypothetical protein